MQESLNLEVYLPLWSREDHEETAVPFFPNYLFVRVDLIEFPIRLFWQTPGLRRLPKFDNQLLPVPNDIIEEVRHHLAKTRGETYARGQLFHQGDRVVITKGPLKGKEALFDKRLSGDDRVRILLNLLGRQVPAEAPLRALEKLQFVVQAPRPPRRTRGRGRRIKQRTRLRPPSTSR